MGSVLVIRNPPGRQLTDIASFSIIGGVAWGSCFLQVFPLLFDDDVILDARGFGRRYVGASRQAIYDQFCRLSSNFRLEIEGYEPAITKDVKGISIGISAGGNVMGVMEDVVGTGIRRALVWFQRTFAVRFSRFLNLILRDLIDDGLGMGSGALTTGVSGGFFNSFDGGALHGVNGNSTLNLEINRIRNMNFCIFQVGGGLIVGAGINLLIIGDFPSTDTLLPHRFTDARMMMESHFLDYINHVREHAYCIALVGDAAVGAILPGVDFNIIGS